MSLHSKSRLAFAPTGTDLAIAEAEKVPGLRAALRSEQHAGRLVGDMAHAILAALNDLRAAVELADTKVTAHTTNDDGTVEVYAITASAWNRVIAIARGSKSDAAERAIAPFRPGAESGGPE